MPTVTMLDSEDGQTYHVPSENMKAAQDRGLKPAVMMTSPEGEAHWVPRDNAARAIKEHGFTVGQPAPTAKPEDAPVTSTWGAAKGVAQDTWNAAKGAAQVFDPRMKGGENALTANPAARIVKGFVETGKQALEVPGAIHDINQSPDPTGVYLGVAQKTASQAAGQAILGAATEGAARIPASAAETAVRTAGKVVKGTLEDIPIVRQVTKVGKYAKEAAKETAARRAPEAQPPAFPQYDKPAAKASAPAEEAAPAEAPKANEHPDAAEFEQKFDFPLSSYLDEAGKFDKHAFINDIVKPRTEPPKAVMARHFGAESVPLIEKLTGEPLRMWESTAPEGAVKGGSARLAAKQAPKSVATNGSGESSASQEAINRSASDRRVGVKYYRVDTRSGVETPIIGADALDAKAGPYDEIIRRGPDGDTTLDAGRSARRR